MLTKALLSSHSNMRHYCWSLKSVECETPKHLNFLINVYNTFIVIYRNGDHLAKKEKLLFDSKEAEIINASKYLSPFQPTVYSHKP